MGAIENYWAGCLDCWRGGWRGEASCAECPNCTWVIDGDGSGSCQQAVVGYWDGWWGGWRNWRGRF